MDEDDDKSIGFSNPSDLFERTDDSLPFYIDVSKENIKCDKKFILNTIPHIQTWFEGESGDLKWLGRLRNEVDGFLRFLHFLFG